MIREIEGNGIFDYGRGIQDTPLLGHALVTRNGLLPPDKNNRAVVIGSPGLETSSYLEVEKWVEVLGEDFCLLYLPC